MLKNLTIYRLRSMLPTSSELENALSQYVFSPCGSTQEKSVGFIPPRGHEHGALLEIVNQQWMLLLHIETKVLPRSVVKRKVLAEMDAIEATTGRKPGKKERRALEDDARLALLPQAFAKEADVRVWIDPQARFVCTDAGSHTKADEVMTWLIKAVHGLEAPLLHTQTSPAAAMAHWLSTHDAPMGFSVDRECELKATDESKAVVRYAHHALDTDEVSQHIALGKMPTRLAMTWQDSVSFVLTEGLQLKKIAFLHDGDAGNRATDKEEDAFDANVMLATGALQQLIPNLIEALGDELVSDPV